MCACLLEPGLDALRPQLETSGWNPNLYVSVCLRRKKNLTATEKKKLLAQLKKKYPDVPDDLVVDRCLIIVGAHR